jgi:hypothetical protein
MGIGFAELLLIATVLAIVGYGLAVPIVGIVKAVRRKDQGRRSTGAVVWSAINVGLFGLGALATVAFRGIPIAPGIGLTLNGVWLYLAVQANQAAARRTTPL